MEQTKTIDSGLTVYEANKQIYAQMTPYDPIFLHKKVKELISDCYSNKYMMLLCRERNDYTLFDVKQPSKNEPWVVVNEEFYIDEFKETIQNRGMIISIEKNEHDIWEIWIKDTVFEDVYVYYFFNADRMVINIE